MGGNENALSEFSYENRDEKFVMFNFLCSLQDPELVWKYIDWVMERDDVLGVQVSNLPTTCFLSDCVWLSGVLKEALGFTAQFFLSVLVKMAFKSKLKAHML